MDSWHVRKKVSRRIGREGVRMHPMEFQLNLRRRGISNQDVLRAMDSVPRDLFVDPEFLSEAFVDTALPIACGQTISQPFVVAYMSEQLRVRPDHRVLEIGTGSGYQAAVLAHLAREVVSYERFQRLADQARARFARLGLRNVEVHVGDGAALPEDAGLFDRIIVTAACEEVPASLKAHLADQGLLIAPVGPRAGEQHLMRMTRKGDEYAAERLIAVRFVPLLPGLAGAAH